MLQLVKRFLNPMESLFLLSVGTGLLTTGQTVWLHQHHYDSFVIGLLVAAYYSGFIYAAFRSEKFIARVSHIRAYSALAAILSALTIIQGVYPNIYIWLAIRFICGYCTAGLFVVIESWLLCQSTVKVRGQVLALYMIFYYAALAVSQFLINIGVENVLRLFSISSFCISLSILPLSATKVSQPIIEEPSALNIVALFKQSPSGIAGCFYSGLVLGPIYGLFPLFLAERFNQTDLISLMMFTLISGGMLLQFPFGKLSDSIDRRKVLLFILVLFLAASSTMAIHNLNIYFNLIIYFLLGGTAFSIYPISMSHACEVFEVKDMVSTAQGLVMVNSIGMVLGPLIAVSIMDSFSAQIGLVIYLIAITTIIILLLIWRQIFGKYPSPDEQKGFLALPRTTPITIEIDPRINNDNKL